MPKITHILFDCDNTLVLSEHIAFAACAQLANEVLEKYKPEVKDRLDGPGLQRTFVGQNFRGMLISLCQKYGFELPSDDLDAYVARELDAVTSALKKDAEPCPGVLPVLQHLQSLGDKYTLAVVSSSALPRVIASLDRAGLSPFFAQDHVYSAISSLPTPTSKPDPAVYLHALKELGVDAGKAIAVEDSKSGATAAVRAGIRLVGYTGVYEGDERGEMEGVLRGVGARVVMQDWKEFEKALEEIEKD
ncbi:putative HAD superfamily hydrolase [Peniophora sp. CONT]|nr:putative HAD superfamily hydrolase [Peniophora sp. CONT]